MKSNITEIEVNGVQYIKKGTESKQVASKDGLTLCMLRTYSAGVFYGWVNYEAENTFHGVEVLDAIRVYRWEGAFTLSQLATLGTSKPGECTFAITVPKIKLNRVVELIPVTEMSLKTLSEVEQKKC